MGLSLSQLVTLLAIGLPLGAVPRRAMVGRWVQAAAAQAGRLVWCKKSAVYTQLKLCLLGSHGTGSV